MKKRAKPKTTKAVTKSMTSDEVRAWLRGADASIDPTKVLESVGKLIAKGITAPNKASKEEIAIISDAILLVGHERHYLVAESVVDERWRSMVMDLASQIQKEYACTTSSEIALAGLAAGSYYRSLRAARKMNALLEKTEIGMVGVQLMGQVSKEIDRTHRHYLSILETLRSRRQPKLNVKIQTRAAFFGDQQTFNTRSEQPYENIDHQ